VQRPTKNLNHNAKQTKKKETKKKNTISDLPAVISRWRGECNSAKSKKYQNAKFKKKKEAHNFRFAAHNREMEWRI